MYSLRKKQLPRNTEKDANQLYTPGSIKRQIIPKDQPLQTSPDSQPVQVPSVALHSLNK
jgi:hypothetical protein